MTFTVTYRGADGALVTEAVEAANRSECFAQMKARGITPMGVKEGDSVSRRERRSRRDGGNGSRAERTILQSSNPPIPQSSNPLCYSPCEVSPPKSPLRPLPLCSSA